MKTTGKTTNSKLTEIKHILARKVEITKKLIDLVEQTKALTRKDIGKWRQAWQLAISNDNPRRFHLYSIYDDVLIDNHLTGAIENRTQRVLQRDFYFIDSQNQKVDELKRAFQKTWFYKFMQFALETIYWGHSLIEFQAIDTKNWNIELDIVPRANVIPERKLVLKKVYDDFSQGIDYSQPPYSLWTIEIEHKEKLGLLLKVAPHCISKKNMFAFWDQFGEIFGMPVRIAYTSSLEQGELNRIEQMLEDMGSAFWAMFPEGTRIELKESSRSDAFNVYDKRIERANSEISKAIMGQTMTMDNGSSYSQSYVHENTFEYIIESDAMFIERIVNDKLIPLLNLHGANLNNVTFVFDRSKEYSFDEQLRLEQLLLQNYYIPESYFIEKYGIPIEPKPDENAPPDYDNMSFFLPAPEL